MTKIKNNGKKIIHVGKRALMPGQEITVADTAVQTPAIQILAKRGYLALTPVVETNIADSVKTEESVAPVTETADTDAGTAATGKKTSTKKTGNKTETAE